MKTTLLKNSKNLLLLLPLVAAGCSSGQGGGTATGNVVKTQADQGYVDSQSAVLGGSVNLFQLEALIPGLRNEGKGLSISPDISSSQARHDILVMKIREQDRANEFLHGYSAVAANNDVLKETLQWNYSSTSMTASGPDMTTLRLAISNQQSAMQTILTIYDENASSQAQVMAEANVQSLPDSVKQQISDARKLSGEQKKEALQKIVDDNNLDSAGDIDVEKREVAEKYVNTAVLDLLSGNQNIYSLVVDATTLKNAYDQIQVTIDAVQKFATTFQGAMTSISKASSAIKTAVGSATNELRLNTNLSDLENNKQKRQDWLNNAGSYLGVLTGNDDTDDSFPGLSNAEKSYQDLKTSAAQMASATDAVGQATSALAEAGKLLNLDTNTQNTLNKASEIAEAGSKIMLGFATGGPMGAVVAGLQASSIFGGGDDASAAANAIINAKLDALLKGQQKIIGLQQETLKLQQNTLTMLVSVAQMIQKDQGILSGIESELVSVSQGQSVQMLLDYSNCISFSNVDSLNEHDKDFDLQIHSAVHALLGDLKALDAKLSSEDDLAQYRACLKGLRDIYLNADFTSFIHSPGANMTESMLDENGSLIAGDMAKQVYSPLLTVYQSFMLASAQQLSSTTAYSHGLHLPARVMSVVHRKYDVSNLIEVSADPRTCSGNNPNELGTCLEDSYKYFNNSFIYTPIVIKNVKALLQWAPMISALGEDGNWHANKPFVTKSSDESLYNILHKSLSLVQAAIAQESLVAGEPIMAQLYSGFLLYMDDQEKLKHDSKYVSQYPEVVNFFTPISDTDLTSGRINCSNSEVYMTAGCLFRKDPYLAKNFVNYFLQRRVLELHSQQGMSEADIKSYEQKFVGAPDLGTYIGLDAELNDDTLPTDQLTQVFGAEFVQSNIIPAKVKMDEDGASVTERRQFVIGGVTLDVPTAKQYSQDKVIYSPNMQELVGLERQLASALAKFEKPEASDEQVKTWIGNLFQVIN